MFPENLSPYPYEATHGIFKLFPTIAPAIASIDLRETTIKSGFGFYKSLRNLREF